jgi:hypothetical protein
MVTKCSSFCDITPCSLLKCNLCYAETRRLHLQGRRISQEKTRVQAYSKPSTCFPTNMAAHTCFCIGLCYGPEDGGDIFLRNVQWLSTECTALHPRTQLSYVSWELMDCFRNRKRLKSRQWHSWVLCQVDAMFVHSQKKRVLFSSQMWDDCSLPSSTTLSQMQRLHGV